MMPKWITDYKMSSTLIELGLYNSINKWNYCVDTIKRNKDSLPVLISIIERKIRLNNEHDAKYWKELLDKLTKYTILL